MFSKRFTYSLTKEVYETECCHQNPSLKELGSVSSAAFKFQDHTSAPFFYLPPEGMLNFAWYSPPSFRAVAAENVPGLELRVAPAAWS